jgi:hypothetical protein
MNKRISVLAATLAGVLGGAVVGGSVLVGASAGSTPPAPAPTASQTTRPCGALVKKLPDALRKDLAAAWKLPAGEQRVAALRKIRKDARAGKYGDQVQRLAHRRLQHRGEIWKRLPADLRSDIKDLRGLSPEQRKGAVADIRKSALAGDYGDRIRQFAQHREQRRAECRPQTTS